MTRSSLSTGLLGVLWIGSAVAAGLPAASRPMLNASVPPKSFGTQHYSTTVISGMQFDGLLGRADPATLSLWLPDCIRSCGTDHYYASLELPAGTVIDYIGVNSARVEGLLGITLHVRDGASVTALASYAVPAHPGFQTDYTGALGILIPENGGRTYVLEIDHVANPDPSYLGYVEIRWRRTVSDPPPTPTFGDVPNGHPYYQFIEALGASGITGGCGGGNFCPEKALTRGQMAVFLAKALGLRWSQ